MTDSLEKEYQERYDAFLKAVAQMLQEHIQGYLTGVPNIDRVTARAKDPGRFAEKARRTDKDGQPKYQKPLTEIQDQIGVRVVVFYKHDVTAVSAIVTRYFQPIEQRELVPESEWAFGYFGQHFVLPLPRDVVPKSIDLSEVPGFFELQIKTLFQHAWSEANHDLGYKSRSPLVADQERRLAFTAAQAWGADRVFDELRVELAEAPE
jgi:ppGpp synthetase/RelA/SpoT-type nucleotidyltranferase